LVAAQARRRLIVRLLGGLLALLGTVGAGFAAYAILADRALFAPMLLAGLLGLAGLGAGASLLLRSRSGADRESDVLDDFLTERVPRIIGGAKAGNLDDHDRRRHLRR